MKSLYWYVKYTYLHLTGEGSEGNKIEELIGDIQDYIYHGVSDEQE